MNLCLGEDGGGLGPEVAAFLAHQREPFRVVPSRGSLILDTSGIWMPNSLLKAVVEGVSESLVASPLQLASLSS